MIQWERWMEKKMDLIFTEGLKEAKISEQGGYTCSRLDMIRAEEVSELLKKARI